MKLFITGISTDVGKTIASAIIVEALHADYWKPIQAGDLEHSDTHKVQDLISNSQSQFHPNSYALQTPASPHLAAAKDGITINAYCNSPFFTFKQSFIILIYSCHLWFS